MNVCGNGCSGIDRGVHRVSAKTGVNASLRAGLKGGKHCEMDTLFEKLKPVHLL